MKTHPIIDYPYRWVPVLVVALVLVLAQVMIMTVYTGADYVPAVIDGIATIGWFDGIRLFGLVCCRSSLYLSDGSHYSGGRNTDLDSRQLYGLRYCNKDSRYTLYHFCVYHPFSSVVLAFRPGLPFFFGIV